MKRHIIAALVIGIIVGVQTLAVVRSVEKNIEDYNRSRSSVMTR